MSYESKYFSRAEMACKCGCGTYRVSDALFERLDLLRDTLQRPVFITSGCRCVDRNITEGGKPESAHVTMIGHPCRAADISAPSGREKFFVIKAALDIGFMRIGVGKNFIHLDVADEFPHPVVWTY